MSCLRIVFHMSSCYAAYSSFQKQEEEDLSPTAHLSSEACRRAPQLAAHLSRETCRGVPQCSCSSVPRSMWRKTSILLLTCPLKHLEGDPSLLLTGILEHVEETLSPAAHLSPVACRGGPQPCCSPVPCTIQKRTHLTLLSPSQRNWFCLSQLKPMVAISL